MDAKAYLYYGIEQLHKGALGEAQEAFHHALLQQPDFPEAYNNLGIIQLQADCLDKAEALLSQAIALRPNYAQAYNNLGVVMKNTHRPQEAEVCFRRAVEMSPGYVDAYNNLGTLLVETKYLDEAEALFRRVTELRPDLAKGYINLGVVYNELGRLQEAEQAFRQAVERSPGSAAGYNNLGGVLRRANRQEEAEIFLRRAIELRADYAEAYNNLGCVLQDGGRWAEAETVFNRALQSNPGCADAAYNLGFLKLLQGQYESGWRYCEARFHTRVPLPQTVIPRWQGENLAGRRILLFHEQGMGDTIHFARYVELVASTGAQGVLWVQKPLARLLDGLHKDFPVYVGNSLPPGEFDFCCPFLSLPLVFNTVEATIPREVPYLAADPGISAMWRQIFANRKDAGTYRVGVAWAGNAKHINDHNRSMGFGVFSTLFDVTGVQWVSLQVGSASEVLRDTRYDIYDVSPQLADFAETAGVIENLDLVITVDTSVAHLAGAMGKKVWVLLAFTPDWRWQLQRVDSPWYPTIRLFRQQRPGDWPGVMARVKEALREETMKEN